MVFSKNFFEPLKTTSKGLFTIPNRPIAFNGMGHVIDPKNQYVFPILRAEQSTYSYSKDKKDVSSTSGEALTLVSGYQTRANQRVALSGSLGICSNQNMVLT